MSASAGKGTVLEAPGGLMETRCAALEELLGSALLLTSATIALILGAILEYLLALFWKRKRNLKS